MEKEAVNRENQFKKNKEGQISIPDAYARSSVYAPVSLPSHGRADHCI